MTGRGLVVAASTVLLFGPVVAPRDNSPSLVGNWSDRLLLTPDGRGFGRSVLFARGAGAWRVSFTTTQYFGNAKPPQSTTVGPLDAAVDGNTIRINGDSKEYTYRLDGDALVLPAFVRMDERTWVIRGPDLWPKREVTLRCEHDPFEVPVGKAEFPSVGYEGRQQFYVLENVPSQVFNEPSRTELRFLDRTLEGRLRPGLTLVWHPSYGLELEADSWHAGMQQQRYYRGTSPK